MIIESSPTNLDPRVGIDAQSERIDALIFDDLLNRDEHLNVTPALAERWEVPDPLTYIFHIRRGVQFHDGRPLTSRDVKWTFDSMLQGKIRTTRAAAYRYVDHVEAPDDTTVVFRSEAAVCEPALEFVGRRDGNRSVRQPYGNDQPADWFGPVSVCQRRT